MALNRFIMAVVFLVLATTVANAYTLVMRNGRRVEIPNEFTVKGSTLTYTVGSGIQITHQLSGIDIAKTERVNGEQPGSFLARASAPTQAVAQPAQPRAQRSITNSDLEGYRRTRIESELAYDKRRKELGLSSAEEGRRQAAAITDRTYQQLLGVRDKDDSAEQYWRERASSLRSEDATTQAQISYVKQRLAEIPPTNSLTAFNSPFGLGSGPFLNFPTLNSGLQIGLNTGQRNIRNRRFPGRFDRFRGRRGPFGDLFGGNLVALPYEPYDYTYERAELVNQLDELQMRNAALRVRWRDLEEEARRAGAYPGWLRP